MLTAVDVDAIRDEFPALSTCIYFQHGGLSPMPRRAVEAIERAARAMHERPPGGWADAFHHDVEALKAALGRLLGVDAGDIALTRATGHGLSLLAMGLDWRAGDNIVSVRSEFPTNVFPWRALEHRGVTLRVAEPVDGRVTAERLLALCDERTRAIAVSFVHFWNGYRTDLAEFGAECRRSGIHLAVDGIQGAGAVSVDLRSTGVGLFAAGCYKWLQGPAGLGLCYVQPELAERLQPPLIGAGTSADPGTALEPTWSLASRAQRFEESSPSWLNVAGLLAAVGLLEEIGIHAVEERVLQLNALAGRLLEEAGCELAPPWPRLPSESSGIIGFRHPAIAPELLVERLRERGVHSRHVSNQWVRFSIHFNNTEAEVERAVQLVTELSPPHR